MKAPHTTNRDQMLDVLKGIAIFLVLLGHSIQYGSGASFLRSSLFFDNPLFKAIYSFHMPLFMIVSGYIFSYTVARHSFSQILRSRFTQLLLPIFVWNALFSIVRFARIDTPLTIPLMAKSYLSSSVNYLWFLWALFFCSLLVAVVHRFLRDNSFVYVAVFIVLFFVPDIYSSGNYKFMYPYFVVAYLYNHRQWGKAKIVKMVNNWFIFILLVVLFIVLVVLYKRDYYIYISGYALLGKDIILQLGIDMYRFLVGFVGSVVVILAVYAMRSWLAEVEHGVVSAIGRASLGIYIISGGMFIYLLPELTGGWHLNYYVAVIEAGMILGVSYLATRVLGAWKVTRLLLLGGRG
jgi:fucose 4-O-acetylase-like acetyltransferase